MNKTELINYLRDPGKLKPEQLDELDELIKQYPGFLSARLVLAKAAKELKHSKAKKYISSAAIYSTDRILLKKYLSGDLFFLTKPTEATTPSRRQKAAFSAKAEPAISSKKRPTENKDKTTPAAKTTKEQERIKDVKKQPDSQKEKTSAPTTARSKPERAKESPQPAKLQPEVPDLPSGSLDAILESLQRDMENLKASREKFLKVQESISDEPSEAKKEKTDPPPTEAADASGNTLSKEDSSPSIDQQSASKGSAITDEPLSKGDDDSLEETQNSGQKSDTDKAISDITQQVLEAARIAKEEVAKEDEIGVQSTTSEAGPSPVEKKETPKKEKETPKEEKAKATTSKAEKEVKSVKEEKKAKPKKKSSKKETKAKDAEEEIPEKTPIKSKKVTESKAPEISREGSDSESSDKSKTDKENSEERAERVVSEPRFSRFSTRSYLRPPTAPDSSDFFGEDEQEEIGEDKDAAATPKKAEKEVSSQEVDAADPAQPKSEATQTKEPTADKPVSEVKEDTAKDAPKQKEVEAAPLKEDPPSIEDSDTKSAAAEEKEIENKSETKDDPERERQEELEKKYNLPDLSKAKAVPRKGKKRKKKVATNNTEDKIADTSEKENTNKDQSKATKSQQKASETENELSDNPEPTDKGSLDLPLQKKKDTKDLIDEFIEKSPSIKYKRSADASPEDLAEESAAWDPELASEYLAEIYLHQGNKKRAKEIYEALRLKYPEKKSYFADLISKIK